MIGKKTIRTLFYTTSGVSVLFTGLLLLPVLLWSFGSQWLFPDLLPQKFSGDRWMEIFLGTGGGRTGRAFFNSFTIALAVTLLNAVIAMPVARYLSRLRGNARIVADLLVLIPLILPAISVVLGTYIFFVYLGIQDSLLGTLLAHLMPTLPYMIIIQRGIFSNLDEGYIETARTLGARPLYLFVHVMLPFLAPGLLVGSLFVFLISWSQYFSTLIIGGGRIVTLPLLLFSSAGAGDLRTTATLTIILLLPTVLLLILSSLVVSGRGIEREQTVITEGTS